MGPVEAVEDVEADDGGLDVTKINADEKVWNIHYEMMNGGFMTMRILGVIGDMGMDRCGNVVANLRMTTDANLRGTKRRSTLSFQAQLRRTRREDLRRR